MIAPDGDRVKSDMVEMVPFIRFHQALIEHLFSTDSENGSSFAVSDQSAAMVMAVLRSSVMLCRGDLFFDLAPAVIETGSAGFAAALAEEIMLFLGISGARLPSIRKDMPLYPPRPERVLNLEGRREKTGYLCRLTASIHSAEFSFPLISESGA